MRGIILKTFAVNENDLIVNILSDELYEAYRFYGVRHSHLLPGNLIDFELEIRPLFLPKLHSTLQFFMPWQNNLNIVLLWKKWCDLLFLHLQENRHCGNFYFNLSHKLSLMIDKINPKRAILNSYIQLLDFEGRLNLNSICNECGEPLEEFCSIKEHLLLTCIYCNKKNRFSTNLAIEFLKSKNSLVFNDDEMDILYSIYESGI